MGMCCAGSLVPTHFQWKYVVASYHLYNLKCKWISPGHLYPVNWNTNVVLRVAYTTSFEIWSVVSGHLHQTLKLECVAGYLHRVIWNMNIFRSFEMRTYCVGSFVPSSLKWECVFGSFIESFANELLKHMSDLRFLNFIGGGSMNIGRVCTFCGDKLDRLHVITCDEGATSQVNILDITVRICAERRGATQRPRNGIEGHGLLHDPMSQQTDWLTENENTLYRVTCTESFKIANMLRWVTSNASKLVSSTRTCIFIIYVLAIRSFQYVGVQSNA